MKRKNPFDNISNNNMADYSDNKYNNFYNSKNLISNNFPSKNYFSSNY